MPLFLSPRSLQLQSHRLARRHEGRPRCYLLDPDVILLSGGLFCLQRQYTSVQALWSLDVFSTGVGEPVRMRLLPGPERRRIRRAGCRLAARAVAARMEALIKPVDEIDSAASANSSFLRKRLSRFAFALLA